MTTPTTKPRRRAGAGSRQTPGAAADTPSPQLTATGIRDFDEAFSRNPLPDEETRAVCLLFCLAFAGLYPDGNAPVGLQEISLQACIGVRRPLSTREIGAVHRGIMHLAQTCEARRRSEHGGSAGKGKSKRPHTELIRRAVAALTEKKVEPSAANVRLLLKSGSEKPAWKTLAEEWGDPLSEIVEVRVRETGPIEIEYTEKWAAAHKGRRFVELDAGGLNKQIARAR